MEFKTIAGGITVVYQVVNSPNPHPKALERMSDHEIDAYLAETYEHKQEVIADYQGQGFLPAFGETLYLGFDTEFDEHPGDPLHPLGLLSIQIHAVGNGGQLAAVYIPASQAFEDRISLDTILDDLIPELLRWGIILEHPRIIVFVGFFARVDLPMFSDFVEFRQALCSVNGRLTTTGPGVPTLICDRKSVDRALQSRQWLADAGRVQVAVRIKFYDVALHAAEKTPLHVLGETIGLRKRKIKPPFHISRQ